MNVILCGMMGAGKTSIGVKIAELTGRRWYDTDQMIMDKYGKISDLFEYYGEEHFRRLETDIVKSLAKMDDLVISSGGGLVLIPVNCERLKENGKIVFLRAKPETLVKRLQIYEDKTLLQANSGMVAQRLKELMASRTPVYEHVADYIVDVDEKSTEETAKEIVRLLQQSEGAGV